MFYKTKICICILSHLTERLDQNLKHQIKENLSFKQGRVELRVQKLFWGNKLPWPTHLNKCESMIVRYQISPNILSFLSRGENIQFFLHPEEVSQATGMVNLHTRWDDYILNLIYLKRHHCLKTYMSIVNHGILCITTIQNNLCIPNTVTSQNVVVAVYIL